MNEKDGLEIGGYADPSYIMNVDTKWLSKILNGDKTVEVRKNDPEKWGRVKKDDILHIENPESDMKVRFRVKDVRTYSSLDAMLITEGLRNVLPGVKTLEEAREIYNTIDGADATSVVKRMREYEKYGLIAIELGVKVRYW